jgi:hypothetical protein
MTKTAFTPGKVIEGSDQGAGTKAERNVGQETYCPESGENAPEDPQDEGVSVALLGFLDGRQVALEGDVFGDPTVGVLP